MDGQKVEDTKGKLPAHKEHGSIVVFTPSKHYLGSNTVIPYEEVKEWLEKISYLLPKDRKIKIRLNLVKGMKTEDTIKYKSKDFSELLDTIVESSQCQPIHLKGMNTIDEVIAGEKKTKIVNLDFAFTYDTVDEMISDSYCNFTNTTSGGVHVDAVTECLCRYLSAATKNALTQRDKDMDILWNDVKSCLKLVINLSTNAQVGFQGNMKEQIGNKDLIPVIKDIVNPLITSYFDSHKAELDKIVKIIKLNAKARIEANKVKSNITKHRVTTFNSHEIKNYSPATIPNKAKNEIFLVEGDSAKGNACSAMDRTFQACFAFRGMTKNPMKTDVGQMLSKDGNKEWYNYVRVLGCGVGKDFDLKKCNFDKIIIMTDADIDGHGITESIALFHIYCLPELVKAGKLYKVVPPLYRLKDGKDTIYVRDNEELAEIYQKKISKAFEIQTAYDEKKMNKSDMVQFILDTTNYQEELIHVSKHFGVNKFFLEMILMFVVKTLKNPTDADEFEEKLENQKFRTELIAYIQRTYKLVYWLDDSTTISGEVDGQLQTIEINGEIIDRSADIIESMMRYGILLKVSEKKEKPEIMSIGHFYDLSEKYLPKKEIRFKGLGEMNASDLDKTTIDPNTRVLIQLTSEDLKRELDVFYKLNGASKRDLEKRKQMMKDYKIKRSDLDN